MGAVLITGTSSGMGMFAAVELARRGAKVIATMRDPERGDRLRAAASDAGVEVDIRALDVTDAEEVISVVGAVVVDYGAIDVLVNNAGQGMVGTAEQLSVEQISQQMDVNYFGPVVLTKAVLPHMRAAGTGRILTITSVGGAVGQPFADAYCGAKFAVEGFMQSLAPVAEQFGVWVSIIEPAAVASDFVQNAVRDEPSGPYADLMARYLSRTAGAFANAQSAPSAGTAIADAVTAQDYRFRWQTSETAAQFVGVSLADADGSRVLGFTREWIR